MIRDRSWLRLLLVESALFVLALALLRWQAWGPKDVVWTLWASSLITGYLTLLLGIARAGFSRLPAAARDPNISAAGLAGRLLAALLAMGFLLGFFSVHFGLFHAVHSLFLNAFFPLIHWPDNHTGLIEQALSYLQRCLQDYPLFIALCIASHVPGWLAEETTGKALLIKPYGNVVKQHLMIMAIGFAVAAEVDAVGMIVFLAVYFLPVGRLLSALRQPEKQKAG